MLCLGLDFGTESVRALLLDAATGREIGEGVAAYPHGVLDRSLPTGEPLPPDFALQHPEDWFTAGREAIRGALQAAGAGAEAVAAVGVDFTASTPLPTRADGTPLCLLPALRREPHAWPKLWKHHGAKEEAERITAVARERREAFLKYYGGQVGLEWLLPKVWEVLRQAPAVYAAAERFIEGGDWVVWRLTGREVRNTCAAGYKALWTREHGYPSPAFLRALDPRLADFYQTRAAGPLLPPGRAAGRVSAAGAAALGLPAGVPVSAAVIDAHAGVPGAGVAGPGTMVLILGTSACHLTLSEEPRFFRGYAGLVADGVLPGLYAYESGQAAVGDLFAWCARHYGRDFGALEGDARHVPPGAQGLLALDWHQGNRSILMDGRLTGLLVGLTLRTEPAQVYRAFLEAAAFGTRVILESYAEGGVAVRRLVACGGLAHRSRLFLEILAAVTGREIAVAESAQAVARGAAVYGALAAGLVGTAGEAVARLGSPVRTVVRPEPKAQAVYERLYPLYRRLHDHFGLRERELMAELRALAAPSESA